MGKGNPSTQYYISSMLLKVVYKAIKIPLILLLFWGKPRARSTEKKYAINFEYCSIFISPESKPFAR